MALMADRPYLDKITASRLEDLARDLVVSAKKVVGWSVLAQVQGLELLVTSLQWRLTMAKNEYRTETGQDYQEDDT